MTVSERVVVQNNYLSYDQAHKFDKEMTACRKAGGDCGDIQNKYAVISGENRQKLHIDVAADPLVALAGEDKAQIEGGLDAAGRPGWLYDSLDNQDVKDYVAEGNSYDLDYLNSNTSKADKAWVFVGDHENTMGLMMGGAGLLDGAISVGTKITGSALAMGANGTVQVLNGNTGDKFDYLSFATAGFAGMAGSGKSLYPNIAINTGGAYATSQIEGQDSKAAVIGAGAGTIIGFGAGTAVTVPWASKLTKDYFGGIPASSNALKYADEAIGKGISKQGTISNLPSISGDAVGAFGAETSLAISIIVSERVVVKNNYLSYD